MEGAREKISDLLHEVGETHHIVYRITDGEDADWASWYADWLVNHSELPQLLGTTPVRSELVFTLVKLDKDFTEQAPEGRWEDWYATRIVDELGAG
ncbi:MAG TPA: hypothetical protein VKG89_03390 [Solirubrobacterales bacterium]|nr:hypothetical protein [Solirubrobacterales bacterium]